MIITHTSNLTTITVLKTAVEKLIDTVNNGSAFSYADLNAYVQSAVADVSDVNGIVSEMMEATGSSTNPWTLLQYIQQKFGALKSGVAVSSGIVFPNNAKYVVKTIAAGVLGGVVNTLGVIATTIGTAIGHVYGAVIAAGGLLLQGVSKLLGYIPTYDESTLCKQNSAYTINAYPMGFMEGNVQLINKSIYSHLDAAFPGVALESPFFYLMQSSTGSCIMLKDNWETCRDLFDEGWISINNDTNKMTFRAMTVADFKSYLSNHAGRQSTAFPDTDQVFNDAYCRYRFCISMVWLLYFTMSTGYNNGISTISIDMTDGSLLATMCLFLQQMKILLIDKGQEDSFTQSSWDEFSWMAITGGNATGGGYYLSIITKALLSLETPWYQHDLPTGVYDSAGFSKLQEIIIHNIATYFAIDYLGDIGLTGVYGLVMAPFPEVSTPTYDRRTFWVNMIAMITGFLVISLAATAAVVYAYYSVKKWNSLKLATAEQAWYAYTEDPTAANYYKYRIAAFKNNMLARFTGGTVLNKTNYWGDTGNERDSSNDDIDSDLKSIVALINPRALK